MTDTYLLFVRLQVLSGLGLSFVLGGLYFSVYREEFLKYWALAHGYGALTLGIVLEVLRLTPETVGQAHAMQLLVFPQYLLLAVAALTINRARLERRHIILVGLLGIAALAVQAGTGLFVHGAIPLRQTLRVERYVMTAAATAWFCLSLARKPLFSSTTAGRITLFFAALQSLNYAALAAHQAGAPVYVEPTSLTAGVLGALLPVGTAAGAFLLILQTSADATRALRESEERYRTLVNTSPDAFTMTTTEGKMALCNQRAADLFGYGTEQNVVGRACRSLIAPSDLALVNQYIDEVLAGGMIRERPLRFRRMDGTEFLGEVSARRVDDSKGHPIGWIALTRDVTQRTHAEERLRLLADALRCAGDCISITDPGGRILYVNDAFLRTYEYSQSELLGQSITLVRSGDSTTPQVVPHEGWRGELLNRSKSGRVFPVALATSLVSGDDGQPIACIGVARDISGVREAEEERHKLEERLRNAQKMESIGRLAGGVAHDFNNLLTVINGYSDLALRRLTRDDALFPYVTQIRRAGEQAAALTQQLLAFSRKQIIQPVQLDVGALVEASAAILRRLVGEDVEVRTELARDLGLVLADPGQIDQVIMNLVANARDAMPDGGRLTIRTANTDLEAGTPAGTPAGAYVLLSISDTGAGMDEETRAHVFEPFFTTKEKGKGTGLGLSTVYGIVEQSHGWIQVDSAPGRGTTFRIYFPRVEGKAVVETAPSNHTASPRGTETVLLVEDQEELREFARGVLADHGYQVLEAPDAERALEVARQFAGPIHLLLTDVVLPGMNGRQLAEQFACVRSGTKVLYTSGYSYDVIANRGIVAPEVAYMPKPYTPAALAEKVREVLNSAPKRTVLVMDDEAAVRSLMQEILADAGYRVLLAEDGRKGMELVRAERPDVVITDMVMPNQEGVETIRMIRKEIPRIKIVAMSGAFGGRFLDTLSRLGADASLVKPVDPEQVKRLVAELLAPVE